MPLASRKLRVPLGVQVGAVAALFVAALVALWATGASVVAQERRRSEAKNLLNLASTKLPDGLVESELFGHEKGAFTGADRQKPGRFERAAGGTLFLDEVGKLPLSAQARILRVLQQQEFERVGGTEALRTDARVISATHRDLSREVAAGRFREDLYHRLNVARIVILPRFLAEQAERRFGRGFPRRAPLHNGLTGGVFARRAAREPPANLRNLN